MTYKLVALDVDGTLIHDNQSIPQENIEVIKDLQKQGVEFVLVTGRPDVSVKQYIKQLGIHAPVLGCNGGVVRFVDTKQLVDVSYIDGHVVEQLVDYFNQHQIYPRYYGIDCVYSFNQDEFDATKNPKAGLSKKMSMLMDFHIIQDITQMNTKHIVKIVYFGSNQENWFQTYQTLKKRDDVSVYQVGETTLDIVAQGVSKGQALLKYALSKHINQTEIIAIGDSENDLSMLEVVGCPVTLENGDERLKDIACMITDSNNDAGVAKALNVLFKKGA